MKPGNVIRDKRDMCDKGTIVTPMKCVTL
jgi:hypothetical protein